MKRYSSDIFKPKFYPKPDFKRVDFTELPPQSKPDYWNKSFAHYPWPEDPYKNNHPFFTKDSIDSFVRLKDLSNHLPNDVNETQNNLPRKRSKSDKTARQVLNDLIRENEEFYASLMEEAKQNVTYQDGTEEINNSFRDTFPSLEVSGAINDAKETGTEEINQAIEDARQGYDNIVQSQDLPQHEIDSQVNNPANEEIVPGYNQSSDTEDYTNQAPEFISEAQPEMEPAQDQIMPLADESMADGVPQQNLERIVQQEEQQGMMGDGIFAPEYFGLE